MQVGASRLGAPAPSVVLRRHISAEGRFTGATDTLLRLSPGSSLGALNAGGTALLAQGPVDAVVYALERARPGRLDFGVRRLAASTAGIQAVLSRDGPIYAPLRADPRWESYRRRIGMRP